MLVFRKGSPIHIDQVDGVVSVLGRHCVERFFRLFGAKGRRFTITILVIVARVAAIRAEVVVDAVLLDVRKQLTIWS